MIVLMITLELRMILQNISRRVVGNALINIFFHQIFFLLFFCMNFFIKSVRLFLAAVSVNMLKAVAGGGQKHQQQKQLKQVQEKQ